MVVSMVLSMLKSPGNSARAARVAKMRPKDPDGSSG
jgi:hypothetical protein